MSQNPPDFCPICNLSTVCFLFSRYGVVYFTQHTEHAYLMACEQAF